ncbi:hypothetical protein GYMLUDRAFT_250354 [Collybiopsis luxurians FD-317 M1]|uniref:Uncharacterized protein n=1 Tax=Collybiopsis luxurians FD-317 M1 TaxID=944289 RepID=A0A0D0BFX5_9AGAR|nr:hypothetical protein GYMLUDRAFT_250354 [Collybiopsis luxurians FD-317 M1]
MRHSVSEGLIKLALWVFESFSSLPSTTISALQLFPDQPAASSSNSGGSRPRIIFKFPQAVQPVSAIPLSTALPSVPPVAKKMQRVAFKRSSLLEYPSVPVSASTPSSLPSNVQSIYDNAYLANSSPEVLEQLPLIVTYHFVSSCRNFVIQDKEWAALTTGLHNYPYYCKHPEELGLASEKPRAQEGKRKAVVSLNAFRKSQLLWQERVHLGEPSREQVIPALSCKGKEVICDPIDVNIEMEAPDTMDSMDLDYPEEVPPASAPIPAVPASTPMKSTAIWKVNNRQSYLIRTAIECVIMQIAELLSGPGKKMIEQDLWALVDGMIQGIFNELKEQLNHPSSEPPTPFSNYGLTQFVESLSMINLSSASIVDAQQDELLRAYQEYHTLLWKSDGLETENLHLKEQVSSQDSQLQEKDEELTHLKSFVRHFKGDAQSTETQQLRGAMESRDSEIEELKKKLAASEEAH